MEGTSKVQTSSLTGVILVAQTIVVVPGSDNCVHSIAERKL